IQCDRRHPKGSRLRSYDSMSGDVADARSARDHIQLYATRATTSQNSAAPAPRGQPLASRMDASDIVACGKVNIHELFVKIGRYYDFSMHRTAVVALYVAARHGRDH